MHAFEALKRFLLIFSTHDVCMFVRLCISTVQTMLWRSQGTYGFILHLLICMDIREHISYGFALRELVPLIFPCFFFVFVVGDQCSAGT